MLDAHRLDRQGNCARHDGADQPWWDAEAAHQTGTLPGVPAAQLVGADVQGNVRT